MKLLKDNEKTQTELIRLMKHHDRFHWAIAWASIGFEAFDTLLEHRAKIEKMIVGLHFYQTHPSFIEEFIGNPHVRFVTNPSGIYHPKIYLFSSKDNSWDCIIGSPNFTHGGMNNNSESMIHISNTDDGAAATFSDLMEAFDSWWLNGTISTPEMLIPYRRKWKSNNIRLKALSESFRYKKEERKYTDRGKRPLDVDILRYSWRTYYELLHEEKPHSLEGRLNLISQAQSWLKQTVHFIDLPKKHRQKIAGTVGKEPSGIDWGLFGSMKGAGYFKQLINQNNLIISRALDRIPQSGKIQRTGYISYINLFKEAFADCDKGATGLATATRLLAIKRPDYFVCIDSKNKRRLCGAFNISTNVDFYSYWDSIILRIQESPWWLSEKPRNDSELTAWRSRTALLDALYYEGW